MAAVLLLAGLHPAAAAHAATGTPVPDLQLATAAGERASVLQDAQVNVLVFFRPGQERSLAGLRELANCQPQFGARPVRWVAIAQGSAAPAAAAAVVREAGFAGPVLIDAGDRLYGLLGIAQHPAVAVVDRGRKLSAFEPFRSIEFCTVVAAAIRAALGEPAPLQETLPSASTPANANAGAAARYRALARALAAQGNCGAATRAFDRALALDGNGEGTRGQVLAGCGAAR